VKPEHFRPWPYQGSQAFFLFWTSPPHQLKWNEKRRRLKSGRYNQFLMVDLSELMGGTSPKTSACLRNPGACKRATADTTAAQHRFTGGLSRYNPGALRIKLQ
jgi:hypothetical protein